MEITPIRTEADYRAALRVVSQRVVQDPSPDNFDGEPPEVLSHKRPLTLRMIRNLNKGLGISAQVLIAVNARQFR